MGFLRKLERGLIKLGQEISKPDSFVKGEEFEDYVREFVFPKDKYDLLHKSHNYETNEEDYVESSLMPDFKLRCKKTNKEFFVEAKFRKDKQYKDKTEWCKPYQLKRYKEIDKNQAPVFICLGLGDYPDEPEYIFIIPMSKLKYTALYDSFLKKYEFHVDKPVFPSYLWKLDKSKSIG